MATKAMARTEREDRLPRWAQDLIGDLRAEIVAVENLAEAAAMKSSASVSNVVMARYARGSQSVVGLGLDPEIIYDMPDHERIAISRTSADPNRLHAYIRTAGRLLIEPEAANAVSLRVRPYR